MKNLNEIAKPPVEEEWTKKLSGRSKLPEITFILDNNLPSIYPDCNPDCKLSYAISELADEIYWHTDSEKRRLKTELKGDRQILELNWDGPILSTESLNKINEKYTQDFGRVSGARMAGLIIRKMGGIVKIENHKEGDYSVRNIIELPLTYKFEEINS